MGRPTITKITVETSSGESYNIPTDTVAIFFTDAGINNILVPYYAIPENQYPNWTYAEAEAQFGPNIAKAVFPDPAKPIIITDDVVRTIWTTPKTEMESGDPIPLLTKRPPCDVGGGI